MTGLVLCGGQSSRMGTDKGLLPADGNTWVETACDKLGSVVSSVAISLNKKQQELYVVLIPERQLIVDNDELSIGGPLHGLLSTHMLMPEEDIFLFACDLLFMETIVFRALIALRQESPSFEAFVFKQEQEAEPLCGIYTSTGLAKIFSAYHSGSLGKHSMKHILEMLNTLYLPLPGAWQMYFKNINTRHDLNS